MRKAITLAVIAILAGASAGVAAEIRGQYLESRACDVYTGPCFANAEMALDGKRAVMAWKVEEGGWNGQSLTGLSVALIVASEGTLGDDGVFAQDVGHVRSVVLVDDQASDDQADALVAFVKSAAAEYTGDVQAVQRTKIEMENDYYAMKGSFKAGRIAEIQTRKLTDHDCVCTNETTFYQPLTDVQQAMPAYSLKHAFTGQGLDGKWELNNSRSAFLATFRR